MIKKKVADALNEQINKELYSSYLYLAMAAYCHGEGLSGIAHWLEVQAEEERGHAMKIYRYLVSQNARVQLAAISAPPADFGTPRRVFEEVLVHEQTVTASIHHLMELAVKESDYATQGFLGWFVSEQIEEEATAQEIVQRFKLVGSDSRGLYWLDRELGQRGR